MRRVNLKAFVRFGEDGLADVGSMKAVRPEELIEKIRRKNESGEINLKNEEEIWVVPEESLIEHFAVPVAVFLEEEGVLYKDERDMEKGETFTALKRKAKREYKIKCKVRAINSKKAARLAASTIGEKIEAKKVVLIPQQTINTFTVSY